MSEFLLQNYLNKLGWDWDSKDGLKNHAILFVILFFLLLGFKPEWSFVWLCALLVCLSTYYLVWKVRRSIKFILFKRVNIVFALYNATESEQISKYLKNFESNFRQQLNNYGLFNIRVHFLASDRRISSAVEAEKLVKNGYAGHTLIVWGELTEHENDIKCKNTNFTYEFAFKKYFPKVEMEEMKMWFNENIQSALNTLNWNLNLKNRQQLETYADNIKDTSIYILGRTLLIAGETENGIEVLKKLLSSLTSLPFYDCIRRGGTITILKELLSVIYERMSSKDFWKKNWEPMLEKLDIALKYNKDNYNAHISLAFYFERVKNDEVESKKHIDIAERTHKRGQNGYLISKAYFYFKHDLLKEGLEIYKMLKRSYLDTNEALLVEDFRNLYEQRKQLQFLFLEGLVKLHWYKNSEGKKILKKFLRTASKNQEKFKVLIEEANSLLELKN